MLNWFDLRQPLPKPVDQISELVKFNDQQALARRSNPLSYASTSETPDDLYYEACFISNNLSDFLLTILHTLRWFAKLIKQTAGKW